MEDAPDPITANDQARTSGDVFTRDRFDWLEQVLSDRTLPLFALHVATALLKNFNRATREAFPYQKTIADKLKASRNGVGNAIAQLAAAGHIEVISPDGRRGGNRYRMILRRDAQTPSYANGGGHDPGSYANGGGHFMPTAVGTINSVKEQLSTSLRSVGARDAHEPKPKREAKQGSRLPGDWTLDDECRIYAEHQGLSSGEIERQAEEFRDYWLAEDGPKASKRDWRAAWRRWCRTSIDRQQRAPSLLLPINGGRHSYPPPGGYAARPRSGGASAAAGLDAYPAARRENQR